MKYLKHRSLAVAAQPARIFPIRLHFYESITFMSRTRRNVRRCVTQRKLLSFANYVCARHEAGNRVWAITSHTRAAPIVVLLRACPRFRSLLVGYLPMLRSDCCLDRSTFHEPRRVELS